VAGGSGYSRAWGFIAVGISAVVVVLALALGVGPRLRAKGLAAAPVGVTIEAPKVPASPVPKY
jgi:hypothetical protein